MGTALRTVRTWRRKPRGRAPAGTDSPGLVSGSHNHPIGSQRRVRHNGSRLGTIWLVPARTLLGVKNHQPGRRLRRVIPTAVRKPRRPLSAKRAPTAAAVVAGHFGCTGLVSRMGAFAVPQRSAGAPMHVLRSYGELHGRALRPVRDRAPGGTHRELPSGRARPRRSRAFRPRPESESAESAPNAGWDGSRPTTYRDCSTWTAKSSKLNLRWCESHRSAEHRRGRDCRRTVRRRRPPDGMARLASILGQEDSLRF
jgi:hypothetical protein